ncbi:MAG: hypothetical protein ACE5KE_00265 [Methanosarcinales archaeon]
MDILRFSKKNLELLKLLKKKKFITINNQKVYGSRLGFYLNIWFLRDNGIVDVNGINIRKQKIWGLTEKGYRLVDLLKQIEEL